MNAVLDWMWNLTWLEAAWFMLAHNVLIFAAAVGLGTLAARRWAARPVAASPPPLTKFEILLASLNVLLTAVIAFAGWLLWKAGWIRLRPSSIPGALADVLLLLFIMDFAMYWLHRLAHHPLLYRRVHSWHHRFDNPRPLTLFVLHPLENLAFGALWLAIISTASAWGGFSFPGMILYLTLNVGFGMCGHIGVQPFGAAWLRSPAGRLFAGSRFHARHHAEEASNFGFYTGIWDRIWKTGERSASEPGLDNPL